MRTETLPDGDLRVHLTPEFLATYGLRFQESCGQPGECWVQFLAEHNVPHLKGYMEAYAGVNTVTFELLEGVRRAVGLPTPL